jgi:putative nucleotidyltransferase with HDIG domain
MTSLVVMAWLVEAKDPYTGGHLWRVSRYANLLASAAGLENSEIARITLGGFLHDLGKIGTPDAILRKPDRLSDEEFAVIKTHPTVGLRMVAAHPFASLVESAIVSHHERPDGKGYPQGLKGSALPLDARIIGICDTFDALTSARPYRRPMQLETALRIIEEGSGTQFDENLAPLFVGMGRAGRLDTIMGHSHEGIPMHECPACGPTIALHCDVRIGDLAYCPNCTQEFAIIGDPRVASPAPTGKLGVAEQLSAKVDLRLIKEAVASMALPLVPGVARLPR